jgi:hypothetical protein
VLPVGTTDERNSELNRAIGTVLEQLTEKPPRFCEGFSFLAFDSHTDSNLDSMLMSSFNSIFDASPADIFVREC